MPSNLATNTSRSFRGRLRKRVTRGQEKRHRASQIFVAERLYPLLIFLTPVDTGRAAGNYQIGIGQPKKEELPTRFSKSRSSRLGELTKLKKLKLGQPVFINNNLKYIQALERGHNTNPITRSPLREKSKGFMVRTSLAVLPLELKTRGIKIKTKIRMGSGI